MKVLISISIILSLFSLSPIKTDAQTPIWEWVKGASGQANDAGNSITSDVNGNTYVTGFFYSPTISFGSTTLTNLTCCGGGSDIYIIKYDVLGNIVWAKSAGGIKSEASLGISTDVNGNIYITGTFQSDSIMFGSTKLYNSIINAFGAGNVEVFIAKYDASGNVLWAKSAGGTKTDTPGGISTDINGNVIITGYFLSPSIVFGSITLTNASVNKSDIYVVKYDALGNVIWAKSYGGIESDISSDICTDLNNNIYVIGAFNGYAITFEGTTLTNSQSGSHDIFVVKYDPLGNVLWAKSAGDVGTDIGVRICTDLNNNIFISGYYNSSTITFNSTILTNNQVGKNDIYFVKYDATGNVLWAKNIGGVNDDSGTGGITTDINGDVYISGIFASNTINIDAFTLTNNTNTGTNDIYIAKYNTSGNAIWAKSVGGPASDIVTDISSGINSNIFMTGNFTSTNITFGNTTLTNTPGGLGDIFVSRLCIPPTNPIITPSGSTTFCQGLNVSLNSSTAASYLWNDNITNTQNFLATTSGNYFVTIKDANGCNATSNSTTVTVNPKPIILNSSTSTICSQYPLNTLLTSDITSTYTWSATDNNNTIGESLISRSTALLNDTIINNTITSESVLYSITPTANTTNCVGDAKIITVNVSPLPKITLEPTNQSFALNANGLFNFSTNDPATIYKWQTNTGSIWFDLSNSGQFSGVTTNNLSINNVVSNNNGNLFRCVISKGVCFDTTLAVSLTVNSTTGINNISYNTTDLNLFPNPSSDVINLEHTNKSVIGKKYFIINSLGKNILSSNITDYENLIDISNIPSGIYTILIENEISIIKFSKIH